MKASSLRSQFTTLKHTSSTIWEPPARGVAPVVPPPVAIPIEREMLDLLERPIEAGETYHAAHDRKERELFALLETLSAVEALALGRRLATARREDAIVRALAERLSPDRRARVTAFIANTRRRIALREASRR